MSFINAMQERYTTKKYNASKNIDSKHIDELKEILRLSPSSINSQPWKFTFVSNEATKEKLSKVSWINTEKVTDSDTVVVFSRINDLAAFEKQIEEELPQGAVDYYKEYLKPLPEQEIKAWFDKQVYLSLGVLLSACAAMNIDATPMEGIEPENYDNILDNKGYATLVAVAIGYRDEDDFNQPSKKPKSRIALEKVVESI
ncbi:nitroreductase/dihydropteridine reductase [Dokdonia sp. Hel_I_63]|uniref:nitroreductase family protein n=1 Tax=Dokdonia sp. Hel_I_63 TaxID=1249996 RepID=UPI00119A4B29|nr:nitroreductase family protein [Dokdonia sp. Hel_I_63]TVZ22144.1 nitroreductase/dihydropteridine reductase [Dokdonia sp. Hel_I_63]